jgi:hypothetical protein
VIRSIQNLAALLLVGGAVLAIAIWSAENVRWEEPACPPATGHGLQDLRWLENDDAPPPTTDVQRLLTRPNFGATPQAAGDLEAGIVDERMISTLLTISREHSVCVQTFKEGHRFLPGVEDGPTIPEGYGESGGLPNTHYFGRAVDIYQIDGEPVQDNGTEPAVLDVGRTLANLPPRSRPDEIIGPPGWTEQLGYGWARGWVTDRELLELHEAHLHLGYREEDRTYNRR